jgi:hypothetical protein
MSDFESKLYAGQFQDVLQEAGWKVDRAIFADVEAVGVVLRGGDKDPSNEKGCLLRFDSALYKLALALQEVKIGAVICDLSTPSDKPVLLIGYNPESVAGKQWQEAVPNPHTDVEGPLPTPSPQSN